MDLYDLKMRLMGLGGAMNVAQARLNEILLEVDYAMYNDDGSPELRERLSYSLDELGGLALSMDSLVAQIRLDELDVENIQAGKSGDTEFSKELEG